MSNNADRVQELRESPEWQLTCKIWMDVVVRKDVTANAEDFLSTDKLVRGTFSEYRARLSALEAANAALEAENERLADDFRRINTLLHAGILIRTDAGTVTRVAQIVSAAIDRIDAAQPEGRNA